MSNDFQTRSEPQMGADPTRWPRRMTVPDRRKHPQHDFVKHVIDYSREHPGVAAFCCLGVGFILGWKLKPW
jgi:hypothetical protein